MAEEIKKENWFRKDLLQAVIIAIVMVAIFEPAIEFTWSWLLGIAELGYTGFLNSVYRNAALGDRNWLDVVIVGVIIFYFVTDLTSRMRILIPKPKINAAQKKIPSIAIKPLIGMLVASFLLFLLLAWMIFFSIYIDLQLNASFQQRLTVLAPAITDQEYKELRASWASMDSREDYVAIVRRMESTAEENNIELPRLLFK